MSLNKPKVSSGKVVTESVDGKSRLDSSNSTKFPRRTDPRRMPIDPNFGKISSVSLDPSEPQISSSPVVSVSFSDYDEGARLQHIFQTSGVSYGTWINSPGSTFSVYVGGVTGSGIVKVRTVYQSRVFDQGFVNFGMTFSGSFVEFTSSPVLSGSTMGEPTILSFAISGDEPIVTSVDWRLY